MLYPFMSCLNNILYVPLPSQEPSGCNSVIVACCCISDLLVFNICYFRSFLSLAMLYDF